MQSDSYRSIYYVHKFNAHRSFADDKKQQQHWTLSQNNKSKSENADN